MPNSLRDYHSSERRQIDLRSIPIDNCQSSAGHDRSIGFYSDLGNHSVGLFLMAQKLFLWWDGEIFELTGRELIHHSAEGNQRQLRMICGEREFKTRYVTDDPVATPYYSEDDVDADFGLWLNNVLSSAERRQHIVKVWRGGIP